MDLTPFEKDRNSNYVVESIIPDCTRDEPCLLGIDEAGRGPVLGPMVYGTCFCPISGQKKLKEMGFADSKTLSEAQREDLFEKISEATDFMGWKVEILTPTYISNSMLRRTKYNLNSLSHDCAIRLIQSALDNGANVAEVYVDTVGDPGKYQAMLSQVFPKLTITVAKKADATYPIVSAASICAKVARDRVVKNWEFAEGVEVKDRNYGSGYPADPSTKNFMKEHLDPVFGYPQFVRFSWSTAAQILEKEAAPVHWEDDDEDDSKDTSGSQSLLNFFQRTDDNSKMEKHRFFKERHLNSLTSL